MKTDSELITSRSNARVQAARAVRDGRHGEQIFIEGVRLVEEALVSPIAIDEAFITANFREDERGSAIIERLVERGITIHDVSENVAASISDTRSPQGIIVLAGRPKHHFEDFRPGLIVYLHEINNPANLGAVLRAAEAASAAGVWLSAGSTDAYSPKSLRSSMGSAFRLPIVEGADAAAVAQWAKQNRLPMTAVDVSLSQPYYQLDWSKPRVVIFGSEAHGLPDSLLAAAADRVHIPMETGVDSLNLAVACGIILFEARRQQNL